VLSSEINYVDIVIKNSDKKHEKNIQYIFGKKIPFPEHQVNLQHIYSKKCRIQANIGRILDE
jgi:hypothetical protein